MAGHSKIEWTDATWNPLAGCSLVSPECTRCYAMRRAWMLAHNPNPKVRAKYAGTVKKVNGRAVWTGTIKFDYGALAAPLAWREPRKIFVNSMSDLFHGAAADEWIDQVFAVMALAPQHTFQVLTKRPERMRAYLREAQARIDHWLCARADSGTVSWARAERAADRVQDQWPLANAWLGTSVGKREFTPRIEELRKTPAAVRFLSLEPLLEDLGELDLTGIDWVIVGGESGPRARPMDPDWARSIRDQCLGPGLAQGGRAKKSPKFFMKQMARKAPIPEDLMVREFPSVKDPPPGEPE